MALISSNSPTAVTTDGAYVYVAPQNAPPAPINTTIGGMAGFANDGQFNVPTLVSAQTLNQTFGTETTNAADIVTQAQVYFRVAQQLSVVRLKDGTETAAVASIVDGTGYATDTIALAGTFSAASAITATITNGANVVPVTYTSVTGDVSLAGVAAKLAAAINVSAAVVGANAFLQAATVTSNTVNLKALNAGTAGNSIALAVAVVGGTVTATAGSATFTTGAAPGVLATLTAKYAGTAANPLQWKLVQNALSTVAAPLWDFTIQKNTYATAETWQAIPAPTTATFITNLVAAINTGTSQRAASVYFVAASGGSTGVIGAQSVSGASTLGTDTQSITTATYIGVDGNFNRTGMYAFRGSGVNAFILNGCTDRNADATIAAFAASEGISMGGIGFASGVDPATAAPLITSSPQGLFRYVNWIGVSSALPGVSKRRINPGGAVLAVIVSTPPWQSVGDKPQLSGYPGIIDSEYTAELGPVSNTEAYVAQQAGLLYLTTQTPQGGGVFALPHGQSAATAAGFTQVSDQRMANYLAQDLLRVIGPFVHQLQSGQSDDPFRALIVGSLSGRYAVMVRGRQIAGAQVIDTLSTTAGAGGNSLTTIAQGFNFLAVNIQTLSPARDIIATLTSGTSVSLQISNAYGSGSSS